MSSTWASVVPAGKVPKDYPHHFDGLYDRPRASVSRRSPRSRAHRGHRAGFVEVGSGGDQGQHIEVSAGHAHQLQGLGLGRTLQKIVGVIVGAASRTGREHLQGSSPPDIHLKPDSGRPRRPGPAPIRAGEGLRAPVAMVVSPRPERAGQADQDGRPSGAALPAIDLSVVRGVGSSKVVPGSVGSYRPVIVGAKLRRVQPRFCQEGERSRESACLQCAFTPLAGDLKTTKTDKKHGSRRESHPLSDRPEFDWPCRT